MTPKQRVMDAIDRKATDRVPIDFGSTINTGITRGAYERLKKYLGVDLPTVMLEPSMDLAQMDECVLRRFNVDTRGVSTGSAYGYKNKVISSDTYVNEWGVTYYKSPNCPFYEAVGGPFNKNFGADDIKTFPWPDGGNPGRVAGIGKKTKFLSEETDYAIVLHIRGGFVGLSQWMRGLDNWLADTLTDPGLIAGLLDRTLNYQLDLAVSAIEAAEGKIDVIHFADDIGTQNGPMVSPATYRELIKPRQRELFAASKKYTNAKILYHSCGSNSEIMDDLIEIGVDAFNPVQTDARGMDAALLKKRFGGKMAFWGGIDTHKVLPYGTTDDVRREVREKKEILGSGGGFVLNPVHNVQADVPPENICALFEAAAES